MPIFLPPTIAGEASWVTSFSTTLNNATGGGYASYSFRQVIPATAISTSGSVIRLTITAEPSNPTAFSNVSIGVRSGATADCTSTPTEFKYSSASGILVPAGTSAVSDALTFSFNEASDHIVTGDFTAAAANSYGYRVMSGDTVYYKAATASYASATVSGFASASGQTWFFSKIEVLA